MKSAHCCGSELAAIISWIQAVEPATLRAARLGHHSRRRALRCGDGLVARSATGVLCRDKISAYHPAYDFRQRALISAMLAPLLGLNVPFRQSFSAIVMSFTIAAAILGAFSPLIVFMVWNAPDMAPKNFSGSTYDFILLAHVAVIALAGTTGNVRLFQLLGRLGSKSTCCPARSQYASWLFKKPFSRMTDIMGSASGSLETKRRCRWNFSARRRIFFGNFSEAVFHSLQQIFSSTKSQQPVTYEWLYQPCSATDYSANPARRRLKPDAAAGQRPV